MQVIEAFVEQLVKKQQASCDNPEKNLTKTSIKNQEQQQNNNNNNLYNLCNNKKKLLPSPIQANQLIDYDSITFLDLSRANFTTIPNEVGRLKNLLSLNVSHNQIEVLTAANAAELRSPTLTQLTASFNSMTINQKLIDSITNAFPVLNRLNLSYQRANQIADDSIDDLTLDFSSTQLSDIQLSGNNLRHLTSIRGSVNLKKLFLHSNRLRTVPQLLHCHRLEVLDLSNNRFDDRFTAQHLDVLIGNCPSLRHLDLMAANDGDDRWYQNASNAIHKCQQLTAEDNRVQFVDSGRLSSFCKIGVANSHTNNNVIAIEKLNNTNNTSSQWIMALMSGTVHGPEIKSKLVDVVSKKLEESSESDDRHLTGLKNSILTIHQMIKELNKTEEEENVSIVLVHFIVKDDDLTVRFALSGNRTVLKQLNLNDDRNCVNNNNFDQKKCQTKSLPKFSTKIVNLCPKYYYNGTSTPSSSPSCDEPTDSINSSSSNNMHTSEDSFDGKEPGQEPIHHEINLSLLVEEDAEENSSSEPIILTGINIIDEHEEQDDLILDIFSANNNSGMTLTDRIKKLAEKTNSRKSSYDNDLDNCCNYLGEDHLNKKKPVNCSITSSTSQNNNVDDGSNFLAVVIQPKRNRLRPTVDQQTGVGVDGAGCATVDRQKFFNSLLNQSSSTSHCNDEANHQAMVCLSGDEQVHHKLDIEIETVIEPNHSRADSSDQQMDLESDHSEKLRSWEYMLEENHKYIFERELQTVDVELTNTVSSSTSSGGSSRGSILPQFFSATGGYAPNARCGDRIAKKLIGGRYDLNAFKVYKI